MLCDFAVANVSHMRGARVVRARLQPSVTCEEIAFSWNSTYKGVRLSAYRCNTAVSNKKCTALMYVPHEFLATTECAAILNQEHKHQRVSERCMSMRTSSLSLCASIARQRGVRKRPPARANAPHRRVRASASRRPRHQAAHPDWQTTAQRAGRRARAFMHQRRHADCRAPTTAASSSSCTAALMRTRTSSTTS